MNDGLDYGGMEIEESVLVIAEAEAEAPFAVERLFAKISDFDLRVFVLVCAGLPVARISDRLDCSPDKVRRAMKGRAPIFDWLNEFLPESERDRAERDRMRQLDAQFEEYTELWAVMLPKIKDAVEKGNEGILKLVMKDLTSRMFGSPPKSAKKVDHSHTVDGEVRHMPVPFGTAGKVTKMLDGE